MNARARLDGADFHDAYLVDADFFAASVRRGNFTRADLRRAKLCSGNFAGARFIQADLRRADLRGAALSGADLRAADLRGAQLTWCDLEGAVLWGAYLDRDPKRGTWSRLEAVKLGFPAFADAVEFIYAWGSRNTSSLRQALAALDGVLLRREPLDEQLIAMFRARQPNHHLTAAAAIVLRAPSAPVVDAAWEALDKGSMSAPYLAAVLATVDPRSVERLPAFKDSNAAVLRRFDRTEEHVARWVATIRDFPATVL